MAHRVRTLLTNPEMRKRFGAASRKIAREKFSMERMVGNYLRLLDGVADRPPALASAPPVRIRDGNGSMHLGDRHAQAAGNPA
jgi:hypothetical protein